MIPRVATVLSAREWEAALVAAAQANVQARLVLRAFHPEEIIRSVETIDVVVAGMETTWVTPARIASWRRAGLRVVGVHPAGDEPSRRALLTSACDEVIADTTPADEILSIVGLLRTLSPRPERSAVGTSVVVAGPRGAPGRTEVALALACRWARRSSTLLLDLDLEAPNLAVRIGTEPRPDVVDISDRLLTTGELDAGSLRTFHGVSVAVGSHRPHEVLAMRDLLEDDMLDAALAEWQTVVVDAGVTGGDHNLVKRSDHAIVVAEASASGLVRAARFLADWSGPPPALVLNRAGRDVRDVIKAARRWTGLEPAAVILDRPAIRDASRRARRPDRSIRRALSRVSVR